MKATRVPLVLAMLLAGAAAGVEAQNETTESSAQQGGENDDFRDPPQGEADAPALGGVIIGILFVAILALFFVGWLRFRQH